MASLRWRRQPMLSPLTFPIANGQEHGGPERNLRLHDDGR